MNNKLLSCLIAGALAAALAGAAPALAHGGGGGGGGHGGGGGGMHGGGMHGGGGGMHFGGGGGWHGGGMHSGHFSRFAFHDRDHFHNRFFHHRFHRFAFVGAYADYNGCLRRVWTSYGPRWVNVCGDYGY
jgi:hypothetical protein